ncbi:S6A18-like protein [Mya arenaria]|uniref:Transporter n=1 Tax=Mya arenaria TaxID=6604 RepID=A0ABY7EWK0_MYAAR|nr:S6A18-like protein [Mya arenaria]
MDLDKSETAVAADSTDGLITNKRKESKDSDAAASTERETWDNKVQYILAVVGFAVGLGNVWRFPYLAQKNGGGAFLIPYTLMLAIEGIPIFYLELAVGQRLRKGAIGAWNDISPYLGGIGIASAIVSFWVAFYYNTIIGWCLYYLVQSFRSPLPWAACPTTQTGNVTAPVMECELSSPTTYFWYRETLNISPEVGVGGQVNWWIVVSVLAAWLVVFLCIFKGITTSGKVVYITATFPYLVLVIFFFRGVTLEGFHHGVARFFTPDFSRLADPQVWLEAATQIFFSLGLAFGGLIAFASYMPVRNNCYKDAVLVSVINCGTSVFAGVVVFSILGFKATQSFKACEAGRAAELVRLFNTTEALVPAAGSLANFTVWDNDTSGWYTVIGEMPALPVCSLEQELEKSASGTGLVFIAFTEAINQFPVPQLWAVLFFLMLLTLGLDSMFGMVEIVVCGFSAVLSLAFCHQAGPYVFILFDEFGDDIELMTGSRPNWYWLACWKYVSPLAMSLILLASLAKIAASGAPYQAWHADIGENISLEWPGWCKFFAAFLILTPTIWVPGVAVVKYFRLYNWTQAEPAFFPREDLLMELTGNQVGTNISEWERKLFYWMPRCGLANEMDEEDGTSTVTSDSASGSADDNDADVVEKVNLETEDTRC